MGKVTFVVLISMLAAAACYAVAWDGGAGDFGWALRAARDLLAGRDPYARPFDVLHIPYPLPAALVGLPFAWLSDCLAGALFFGLSTGLLAYGYVRERAPWWRLLIFASPSYVYAMWAVQWSPLMVALWFYPALAPLGLAKPHIGLPVVLAKLNRETVALVGIAAILSVLILPLWPLEWLRQIKPYGGDSFAVFVIPALILARFDRQRGGMLAAMALMPQRPFYDQLALWLLPDSARSMILLTLTSWVGFCVVMYGGGWAAWRFWVGVGFYLPVLAMILDGVLIGKKKEKRSWESSG